MSEEDKLIDDYTYKPFPWISKSKVKTWKFCPFCFYKEIILKERGDGSIRMYAGTDTHMIFARFFNKVDLDYIYENIKVNFSVPAEDNEITLYFFNVAMKIVPKADREVPVMQRILWKFAVFETMHFLYLYNLFNGNKKNIKDFFIPFGVEAFFSNDSIKIYGTIDRGMFTVYIISSDKTINKTVYVGDYKTGSVPKSVRDGPKNPSDDTSWVLPSRFVFEIHFYMLLYLLESGWELSEQVIRFCNDDEYLENGVYKKFGLGLTKEEQKEINTRKKSYLTSLKNDYKPRRFNPITKKFQILKPQDITGGIIFLSGDPAVQDPIVTKKKWSYTSYKAALVYINQVRVVVNNIDNDEYYYIKQLKNRPEYSIYKCPHCSLNSFCLEQEEKDRIKNRG